MRRKSATKHLLAAADDAAGHEPGQPALSRRNVVCSARRRCCSWPCRPSAWPQRPRKRRGRPFESRSPSTSIRPRKARKESGHRSRRPGKVHKEAKSDGEKAKRAEPKPWNLSNGQTMWESASWKGVPLDNKEIGKLIAKKKYKLLRTFDSGTARSNGSTASSSPTSTVLTTNFSMPLDNVTSWADYERKQEQQRQQRHEKINQAIAAGRFRLLNVETLQSQLCRDPQSSRNSRSNA